MADDKKGEKLNKCSTESQDWLMLKGVVV